MPANQRFSGGAIAPLLSRSVTDISNVSAIIKGRQNL
jgi:hypothetical protein